MHIKLHRMILITMLALVMTSGSFLVSMAAVESDEAVVDAPAASANTSDTVQDATADDDATEATEDAHVHSEECEHCKAEEIEVIEVVTPQVATVAVPAANNAATGDTDNTYVAQNPPVDEDPNGQEQEPPKTNTPPDKPEINPGKIDGHPAEIEWGNYVEPTCDEGGYYEVTYLCKNRKTNCTIKEPYHGYLGTDKIYVTEALGHVLEDWEVVKEPTTEEAGERARFCKVCGEKVETEEIEKLKEFVPTYVTVEGPQGSMNAIVDDKGTATLKDFFMELEKGSKQEEQLTMTVGGKTYNVTRYANGKITGLPSGYTASGRDLKISGVKGSLDIKVSTQGVLGGGVSSEPSVVRTRDGGLLSEDGSYYEPPASTGRTTRTARNTGTGSTNTTANSGNSIPSYAESMLTDMTGNKTDKAADAATDTDETPSASSFFKADPNGSTGSGLMLSESSGGAPSKMVIAVDIALISALIIGIGVLWKLGILKFFR